MHGANIFDFTLNEIPKSIKNFLKKNHFSTKKINYFIFHQASEFIIKNLQKKLNIPTKKVIIDMENIGNTVSATIPIAIKQSIDSGLYKSNMNIMLMGFGVGLSIAGCIIRS